MPFPTSNLSQENILRDVHDPITQSLRTTAQATIIVPGGLDLSISHTNDSIRLGDGVNLITSSNVSGKQGLDVNIINSASLTNIRPLNVLTDSIAAPNVETKLDNLLTELQLKADLNEAQNIRQLNVTTDSVAAPNVETKLDSLLTELQLKADLNEAQNIRQLSVTTDSVAAPNVETKLDNLLTELQLKADLTEAQNIRDLNSTQDSVSVPQLNTTNTLLTNANTTLTNIQNSLSNPLTVNLNAFTSSPDSVQLVGSEDGTATGNKFGVVYTIRQAILDAKDRNSTITYADFGNKNQRITSITYTSPSFPGVSVVKQLTYTLVGNKYRRDNVNWIVI
jgi:hypothetical protein